MIIIKVTTSNPELPDLFLRQTPQNKGIWGDCQFIIDQTVERFDWWIVCHASALKKVESIECDPSHIVYISMEPIESIVGSGNSFVKQFSKVLLCDRTIIHPNIKYINGITWWVGMNVCFKDGHHFSPVFSLNYDTLKALHLPEKQNRISVICSNKKFLPGHLKRISFIERIMAHPISQNIDFYGGGIRQIPDKWDAIGPYKYHLVFENCVVPDYWSEKLGDAFLGYALPIYYGCPNINSYFDDRSLIPIDIEQFDKTISILENLIINDTFSYYLPAIIQARNKVLNDYNIFQLMADISREPAKHYKKIRLRPVTQIKQSWSDRLTRKIKHLLS